MSAIDFLSDLAQKLREQDNLCTASPIYCIQEHQQVVGIDPDYTDNIGFFSCEDGRQAEGKELEGLEARYDEDFEVPEGWNRAGYDWRWQYTGLSFLTHDAAHGYVANNKHRHEDEIRVYVDSAYRNREMKEVRRLLAGPLLECVKLLIEARATLEMWKDVAPSVSLCADIDKAISNLETAKEPHQ